MNFILLIDTILCYIYIYVLYKHCDYYFYKKISILKNKKKIFEFWIKDYLLILCFKSKMTFYNIFKVLPLIILK